MAPKGGAKQRFTRTRTPVGHGDGDALDPGASSSNILLGVALGGARQRMMRSQRQAPAVDQGLERAGLAFENHIAMLQIVFSLFYYD